MEQAICLDTPDQIDAFRILALKGALKLEVNGMKMSRGRTAYSRVKEEFGFKGGKQKVLDQLMRHIWDTILRVNECAVHNDIVGWIYIRRGDKGYWEWKEIEGCTPEELNKLAGNPDRDQLLDMEQQSMFGWRVK